MASDGKEQDSGGSDSSAAVAPAAVVGKDMDGKALVSLKSQGMQVTEISDAERKNIIEKLKPVSEKLAKDIGEPLVKQVRAEIDRIRGISK